METFTYYYVWFFILVQIITFLKAYAVFGTPEVSFRNRALVSLFNIVRAFVSVWLGLKLLDVVESKVIDSFWVVFAIAIFYFLEMIAVWFVESWLLGKPLSTVKDIFS